MKPSTKHDPGDRRPVVARRAGWFPLLSSLGWPERCAVVFGLAHIVSENWIAMSQSFLALTVISVGIAIRKQRLHLEPDPLYIPLLFFAAGSTLSALFAPNPLVSVREAGEWFTFLVFPVMLVLARQIPGFLRAATVAFGALLGMSSVWGLVQFFALGQHDLEHRITGPAPHVMTFSGIVLPVAVVAMVLFLERRRLSTGLLAAASGMVLVATLTRSAWIGWLVGIGLWMVLRRSRALLWVAPLAVLLVTFAPMSIFSRMISTFDLRQYSNLDRIRMVQAGIEIIRDNPVFGVGPGNVPEVYARYRRPDAPRFYVPHLHDNPVQIWAARGIVPLFGFLAWYALFLWRCLRMTRDPGRGTIGRAGIAAAAALFVAGLFEFNFGDSEVVMTMLALSAIILVAGEGPLPGEPWGTNGSDPGVVANG